MKRRGAVADGYNYNIEEFGDGGFINYTGGWTVLKCAKYAIFLFAAVLATHFLINFYGVWVKCERSVIRSRAAAEAELRQECCAIFPPHSENYRRHEAEIHAGGSQLMVLTPSAASARDPKKTADCQRILEKDQKESGVNRCERAYDHMHQFSSYQTVLEVWAYYVPLGQVSLIENIVGWILSSGGTWLTFFMGRRLLL